MRKVWLAVVALTLLIAGCSASGKSSPGAQDELLAKYGLAGKQATEVIDHLDRLGGKDRPADLMASVRPTELQLSAKDGTKTTVDLPKDRFYLSVAPYVHDTHECYFHSLTTCKGELSGEDVHVTITDKATGEVLVDEATTTFANGFVGFWLPRDIDGTISVSRQASVTQGSTEHAGQVDFSTRDGDPTCLTTLRLT